MEKERGMWLVKMEGEEREGGMARNKGKGMGKGSEEKDRKRYRGSEDGKLVGKRNEG